MLGKYGRIQERYWESIGGYSRDAGKVWELDRRKAGKVWELDRRDAEQRVAG